MGFIVCFFMICLFCGFGVALVGCFLLFNSCWRAGVVDLLGGCCGFVYGCFGGCGDCGCCLGLRDSVGGMFILYIACLGLVGALVLLRGGVGCFEL